VEGKGVKAYEFDSDQNYQNLLTEIKGRLKKAQLHAAITLNQELICHSAP
jgi:hypothetical protein